MAKSPQPGQVKTRMVPPLDHEQAADIASALLRDTVANALACRAEVVVSLAGPPGLLQAFFADLDGGGAVVIRPQHGATFADRLAAAQAEAFDAGAARVLLLAADCPTADPGLLTQAFDALDHHHGAISRAHDGGYALLSTGAPSPRLFDGIQMGTDTVHAETVARAAEEGLSLLALPARHDLDRIADFRAAAAAGELAGAPATRDAVVRLGLLDDVVGQRR